MSSVLGSSAGRKVYYDNTAILNIFKSRSYNENAAVNCRDSLGRE